MSKASAKVKAPRSSKQSKQKLAQMMRNLSKTKLASGSKAMGSCNRTIYCF